MELVDIAVIVNQQTGNQNASRHKPLLAALSREGASTCSKQASNFDET
ncbi:MAG: hypothetical protein WAJ93_27925 [Candidatus Nitrosopolaris sp.]|jgi:hypothetical protein